MSTGVRGRLVRLASTAPLATLAWLGVLAGCGGDQPAPERHLGPLEEGARFLDDGSFRRAALERSLVNPKNTYSRQRLSSYALGDRGWDLLPVWNPRSVVLDAANAERVARGEPPVVSDDVAPMWNGERPRTREAWAALGREVFFRYPLRAEPIVAWALSRPDLAARAGVRPTEDGAYPGLVAFVDIDGATRVGLTCAMCHSNPTEAGLVVGEARRAFDYGAMRLAFHDATNTPIDAAFARRLRSWGPGRADVTEDDDEDPVAIPDLWGVGEQTFLTQAGTIRQDGIAALAIRQETQLITANDQGTRPPRELALALAFAIHALAPPPERSTVEGADAERVEVGRALFRETCQRCHSNAAGGGDLVSATAVGTNRALADGAARGTGAYRPPSLVRVRLAAPYFHDGSVARLEDVLSPARLAPDFDRGFLGPGPVIGHTFGTQLPQADRDAIVAYLRTR